MENNLAILKNTDFGGSIGEWSVHSHGKLFRINNNGIKLWARGDEGLYKIVFDVEKKTIEVFVAKPTLPAHCPRKVSLKDAELFFNEIRNNLEDILIRKNNFSSVIPNEDRTVFEVR